MYIGNPTVHGHPNVCAENITWPKHQCVRERVFCGGRFWLTREDRSEMKLAARKFVTINLSVVEHFIHFFKFFQTQSFGILISSRRQLQGLAGRLDGFGGLVVSMLASGTQICGFKPGRSRWIFTGIKIFSMPSSGGEVKESVPCPSFAACKRT